MCSEHFIVNPKRIGTNNIPSIFAWFKRTTPTSTKGGSTLSFPSNDDNTAKIVAIGPSTNQISEEEDSAAIDVSSEPLYHLHLMVDTALKESSLGTQRHSEHALDKSVISNKSGLDL